MRPVLSGPARCFALFAAVLGPAVASAQVKSPAPPENYDAQIRYRINADRNERVLQFESLLRAFGAVGFAETPNEDNDLAAFDSTAERMVGTIPSKTARDLLKDSRVKTILLAPAGFKMPDEPLTPVRVLIELASNPQQLALFDQASIALAQLGFRKDIGFDARKYTVLRGTIPAGKVATLLKDLRQQPAGWVLPETTPELFVTLPDGTRTPNLVKPLADGVPVRVIEVLGLADANPAVLTLPPIPADQPQLVKWTPDLRRRLAEEGSAAKPARFEVVLATAPTDIDYEWREMLNKAGATIEGRVGPVITVSVAQGSKAADLAALADVVSVRLPRLSATVAPVTPKKEEPKDEKKEPVGTGPSLQLPKSSPDEDPLKLTRLDRLHAVGKTGKGSRVVIIDSDFAGWKTHLSKPLGKGPIGRVTFIDVTAERNRTVVPDPMPGDFGHGTHCALAVRLAAPEAELTLVRVPADAPYHLVNVGRSIRGDDFRTEGLIARRQELGADIENLRQRKLTAQTEYRRAFENFDADDAAQKRRVAAQQALRQLDEDEANTLDRMDRIIALETALAKLKGTHVVLGLLFWNTGFALDGASATSQFLDDWLVRSTGATYQRHLSRTNASSAPVWIQPAGDTRGQTWTGLFRDTDRNGVMEFAAPNETIGADRWSRELNFLTKRGDKDSLDFAAGTKVRISVQWSEPHDRELSELDYREPVVPLKLQLVKQRDPSGEKFSSDEIDLIAESEGVAERLLIDPNYGVYEHSLELTLPADGRYAVRIEGRVPNRTRPGNVPTLTSQEVKWELRPRLFVDSADGSAAIALGDYSSPQAGVAVPADARSVVAVGAADAQGRPLPYSAGGAGPMTQLGIKPDVLAPVIVTKFAETPAARGTALSASFAAGFAATLKSAGLSAFPHGLRLPPGAPLVVPEGLLGR